MNLPLLNSQKRQAKAGEIEIKPASESSELYSAAINYNLEKVVELLGDGLSPNMVDHNPIFSEKNVALAMLTNGWTDKKLDILDVLLDHGLDINFQTPSGDNLLIYMIGFLSWWDYSDDVEKAGVESKFELGAIIRLRKSFNKLMRLKPILCKMKHLDGSSKHIFEYALQQGALHWFEPHIADMSQVNQKIFESYRLAMLFEKY